MKDADSKKGKKLKVINNKEHRKLVNIGMGIHSPVKLDPI